MTPRIALVTGASSGIGRASSQALREAGFRVVASARAEESVEALRGDGFDAVQLDVTVETSRERAIREIVRTHGRVDLLVNNAGYGLSGPVERLDLGDVRAQFETNVFGLVALSRLVLPGMRERGSGRIVNIGSIGGTFTAPGSGAYHASKYAVEAFSDALRLELAPYGVHVVLLQPTGVYTEFAGKLDGVYPDVPPDDPYAAFIVNHRRVTREMFEGPNRAGIVQASDVARVVVKSATAPSPKARYKVGAGAVAIAAIRALLPSRQFDKIVSRPFVPRATGVDRP